MDFASVSGVVNHPPKYWYMQLAVKCVSKVNSMVDEDIVISYPSKAMIRCGLAKKRKWHLEKRETDLKFATNL